MRHYFRASGKQAALPGQPGSVEFMAAYQTALAALEAAAPAAPTDIGASRTRPGSVNAAVALYFGSRAYAELALETRMARRRILERFREQHGDKALGGPTGLRRPHVEAMLDQIEAPFARNNFLKALRALIAACLPAGLIDSDPTAGVRVRVPKTAGFQTWSEDDILQFEARHAIGSKARLAFALLLYTGQRRGDVVRLGRQHVHDGFMRVRQAKTGAALPIPLHPALKEILAATPPTNMTFLTTSRGQPFSPNAFTNWFHERCREAGLSPNLSAHGLRKAMCRRLAELGCSAHQIMAISGHASLSEAQRYCAAADQKRLAEAAMAALAGEQSERETGKPESPKLANPAQAVENKGGKSEQSGKFRSDRGPHDQRRADAGCCGFPS
jgi:integrase